MVKDKAKELVDGFMKLNYSVNEFKYTTELEHHASKQCALICADVMIKECEGKGTMYWQEVKHEINNL